jgi:ADP-ribose pyrophosphatase YjhB (NUDIX family)
MNENQVPQWLRWAREIHALAHTSHHYAQNEFEKDRSARLIEIAAEIVSQHTGLQVPELVEKFYSQPGYITPKVDVRGAVFNPEGKLLMVQESLDDGWTLPGGWADVGDEPSEATEREVWEEAGFQVKAKKILGVYDGNKFGVLECNHAYKLVFLCELIDGEARPSNETTAVGFFGRDEIPQPFSGERTNMRHIEDAFATWEDPSLPTIFD